MPKVQLDATFCLTAQCPPGKRKIDYYDKYAVTGFVLEVRSSGNKTYYLRYFDDHGRQRQHKIGRYEDISFAKALKLAKQLRSQVVVGEDPAAQKAQKKAVPTYAELAKQHLAYAETHLRSHANIEAIQRLHLLPRWGTMRITDIKAQDIALWLAEKREQGLAPATVEKLRVTFGRSFELAAKWNIAGGEINPVRGVARVKFSNARERFLTPKEAAKLQTAVAASENKQLGNIVALLLLTGARKRELLDAKWEHVDLERKAWLIPTSKTGTHRYVPLSKPAIAVIKGLPTYKDCPWLLPNPDTKKPFVSIKRAWDTARTSAGLSSLRIHDLRHSAASFMINSGVDLYAVGRILGHADHKSTMRYSHLANDTLLAAVEAGAARMNTSN